MNRRRFSVVALCCCIAIGSFMTGNIWGGRVGEGVHMEKKIWEGGGYNVVVIYLLNREGGGGMSTDFPLWWAPVVYS